MINFAFYRQVKWEAPYDPDRAKFRLTPLHQIWKNVLILNMWKINHTELYLPILFHLTWLLVRSEWSWLFSYVILLRSLWLLPLVLSWKLWAFSLSTILFDEVMLTAIENNTHVLQHTVLHDHLLLVHVVCVADKVYYSVAVIPKSTGIRSPVQLKGRRLCSPGRWRKT